ncbi:sigma 54-interacting transcriptional regulator [Agarivorans sp.]|uniref:sigma 54-interacting transcriptional regulator n=1 Tax=Agarivorans sp. TaxID=1872412 RepID=UPI003CFCA41F
MNEINHAGGNILVVDDDPSLLRLISLRLQSAGYQVQAVASAKQALAELESYPAQLVISDVRMDGMDGLALFGAIKQLYPSLPVMLLTAHGNIPDAIAATQQGVFGYLTKPFDSQELLAKVAEALRLQPSLHEVSSEQGPPFWRREIISRSPVMEVLLKQVQQVAPSDVNIMIQGESGSGKELLAKAIHHASPRRQGPFVAVNCAAVPEGLFESELFGHAKGAFSGAAQAHQGLFQAANGGTLFLDEIADTPLSVQVKLLRALQEREVRPVGSTKNIAVDVRIVSASHQDLYQAVQQQQFREDLYYRLNVVELALPPLVKRREDIPLLVHHFSQQIAERQGVPLKTYSPEAMSALVAARWPGNVRQLMNVVEQTNALSTGPLIPAQLVQQALREKAELVSFSQARDEFERGYLARLLRLTQGNVSQAARLAMRNRTEFYKLLERHHLRPESFRG